MIKKKKEKKSDTDISAYNCLLLSSGPHYFFIYFIMVLMWDYSCLHGDQLV